MKRLQGLVIAGLMAAAAGAAPAAAQNAGVNVGSLECVVEGGIGLIITSSKGMDCVFRTGDGYQERYTGTLRKFGVDIGITGEAAMAWLVFAPGVVEPGALEGTYGGGSAEATAGVGAGANVLVGGANIHLQPVSVQVQSGLNVAAGVSSMELRLAD